MSLRSPTNAPKMKSYITKIAVLILSGLAVVTGLRAAGPSEDDVGEAGSFAHPALYMGASSGFVTLSPACTPAPAPSPPATANNDQCFNLNPCPTLTTFTAEDICRIKLPKKATRTIIYPVLNFFHNYQLENTTVLPVPNALFDYRAYITIESDALLDPSCTDPNNDGMPCNGKLQFQFTPNRVRDDRSMNPADRARNRLTFTRAGNAGINKAQLVESGVSSTTVDALFLGPMTIRLNIAGSARCVTDASITGNMRLFGD